MKNLLTAFVLSLGLGLATAQTTQPTTSKKVVPVKSLSVKSELKKPQIAAKSTTANNVKKVAVKTTSTSVKLKKDGTPDKRYKSSKVLKKDGTPDKRFKENK